MRINVKQKHGKKSIEGLIRLTKPKKKTKIEIYKENQKKIINEIFAK